MSGTPINYLGLEPITNTGTASDIIFDLGSRPDFDAVLSNSGGASCSHGTTFESTSFSAPTGSLTINGGGGRDKITISGIVNLVGAALTVTAEEILVTGAIITTGSVSLAASDANTANTAAPGLNASVLVDGSITAGGAVVLSADTAQWSSGRGRP